MRESSRLLLLERTARTLRHAAPKICRKQDRHFARGKSDYVVRIMRASHLDDYYSFLRFPSVSTDTDYSEKVTECAHWLVKKLTGIGLEAKLVPTPGHP